MNDTVQLLRWNEQWSMPLLIEDRYSYHAPQRHGWLVKHLLRWLKRQGVLKLVYEQHMERTYETMTVNYNDVLACVLTNKENVERLFRMKVEYIVIGRRMMVEVMKMPQDYYGLLTIPSSYRAPVARNGERVPWLLAGLTIIFVPWIEGCFCLPDLGGRW